MPYCDSCAYWGRIGAGDVRFDDEIVKARVAHLERKGIKPCARIPQTDHFGEGIEEHSNEIAGLETDGAECAYLWTRKSFGCACHTVKRTRPIPASRPCRRGKP